MTRGDVGVVVIGRNEGERLVRCLESLRGSGAAVVYVDSASSDGSVAAAAPRCAAVVELDMSIPFSAARARNAGVDRLLELRPATRYVQFVDGDCEVVAGWLDRAVAELDRDPALAVVCGRRRERFPERTIYNRLCDIEWGWVTAVGPARYCGGDAMMRVSAFRQVGGFDPSVIAGEEPELCARLRRAGATILRVDQEMTLHDAAMTRFGQWWTRSVRAGHCFAHGFALHGAPPERMWLRKNVSILAWALALPALALGGAWPTSGASLLLLAAYPASIVRQALANRARGMSGRDAWAWGFFCSLGNFANLVGQATFLASRLRRRAPRIIEYKGA